MYKKFKDCLLAPSNIADYIDEPKRKTIGYFFILLFLYVLPLLVIVLFTSSISNEIADNFIDDFYSTNALHYQIKNHQLVSVDDYSDIEIVESSLNVDSINVPTLFVFDLNNQFDMNNLNVKNEISLVLVFKQNELSIMSVIGDDTNSGNNNGMEQLAITSNRGIVLFNDTYQKLKLSDIDFSRNVNQNDFTFNSQIVSLIGSIYQRIKNKLLFIIIPIIIIVAAGSYLLSVLFVAFLEKLIYGYLRISFSKIFKAVLLSSTPYVICCIISNFTGLSFLEVIGDILMIVYTIKALTAYKIKYDGGIKIPLYMMHKNSNQDSEPDDKKGSGDNEL